MKIVIVPEPISVIAGERSAMNTEKLTVGLLNARALVVFADAVAVVVDILRDGAGDPEVASICAVAEPVMAVWVLLGLRPFAPLRTLLVKPYLPEWLLWVSLTDLRVGKAVVSLTFWRRSRGRMRWKILKKQRRLLVLEQPLELDSAATLRKRFRDISKSLG